MRRRTVGLLAVAALVYATLCAGLYAAQRSLLYYPTPESRSARAEALRLETGGAILKIWRLRRASDRAIVYFGGNAEDVAWNIDDFAALFPDSDMYLVNYRGYGGSTGSPSEAALLEDAAAVFDRVRAEHAAVSVIGRSLGSGVAVHLATVRDVRKLVLVTPFDSVTNVAKKHFAIFPVSLLIKDEFDSIGKAAGIRVPTLVLIAEHDRVIPRRNSERLAAAFLPEHIETLTIRGATHDSISDSEEYRSALRDFLRS